MKIIYTAGPYRGDGWNAVFENIVRARVAARQLWLRGWAVICPHANTLFMDGPEIPAMSFINGDLAIIDRCDAILMLPGWERSVGARMEYQRAVELGMPIYLSLEDVPWEEKNA